MEKSSKRGKIPQSDWPLIMARYDSGETLASIARTYDCSPPAISYVVSRSRARQPGPVRPPAATEPQLVKAEAAPGGIAKPPPAAAPPADPLPPPRWEPAAAPPADRAARAPGETGGFFRNGSIRQEAQPPLAPTAVPPPRPIAAQGNGHHDVRRTLHLSLGSASLGNGVAPPIEPAPSAPRNPDRRQDEAPPAGFAEPRPAAPYYRGAMQRGVGDGPQRKEAGSFIDKELRARVDDDIAAFLAAFDMALEADTQESRSALREATDRLLRAGARTRIELERLEARQPLPRDGNGRIEAAWRPR